MDKLNKSRYIAMPKFGPLEIEFEDWKMLVRHVKALCRNESVSFLSPWQDVIFVVISCNEDGAEKNRILFLPVNVRCDDSILNWMKKLKNVVAFGYVRGNSDSIKPDDEDVALSVQIDAIFRKPIYYIIMNRNFEYEIYKNPMDKLYGLMQPAGMEK
jgi:hypothetical protein